MNRKKKTWGIAFLGLCIITSMVSAFFLYRWNTFEPSAYDANIPVDMQSDSAQSAASDWIVAYMKQFEGVLVPYGYRIKNLEIIQVTALDEPDFYAVEYRYYPATPSNQLSSILHVRSIENQEYRAKTILCIMQENETNFYVSKVMDHTQYLFTYESEPMTYQQPSYELADKDKTYRIQNETLEVTYDHGNTFKTVPIVYEDITRHPQNTLTQNLLQEGSYIVSDDYTAFLYTKVNRSLGILYSLDQGVTWKESEIGQDLSQRVKYIAKTEHYVYVLTASEKAMSSEGHVLFRSEDFSTFQIVENYHDPETRLMTYATFIDDQISYVAYTQKHFMDSEKDDVARFYRSEDSGMNYQEIILPRHEVTMMGMTYAPFVQVEKIYQADQMIYVEVGQGENGDYGSKDGLYKALYKSEDGIDFTFVEEFIDEPELAG